LATPLACLVLLGGESLADQLAPCLWLALALLPVKAAITWSRGFHRHSWAQVTFRELIALTRAVFLFGVALTLAVVLVPPLRVLPLSFGMVEALLAVGLLGGARAALRLANEARLRTLSGRSRRVLLVGAGEAGTMVVRELLRHPDLGLHPIGFLDDDPAKRGVRFATVPVLGQIDDLGDVLKRAQIDEVLLTLPSVPGRTMRRLVRLLRTEAPGVPYRTVPGVYELLAGDVTLSRIREVQIEDLLRRDPVRLVDDQIASVVRDKRVLVTGAGGSIGSELVRQLVRYRPAELILFGHGENSIFELERELDANWPQIAYTSVIGAVQNGARLDNVFERSRPEVVFHTAAHKHVPLMELNPEEVVFNNIVGSRNLIDAALRYGSSHLVNISTDKAVKPTSVMGASKRFVEYLVQSAARRTRTGQTFVSVRFGNVLGSRGSVIPLFQRQIARGGPVTVTHPEMVRYFMTIPEAAQLVLQAMAQGRNGEIYMLDMGEPVNILDLANDLVKLSGLEPGDDIPIVITGSRPGEKLREELMTEDEFASHTAHEKIFVARPADFDDARLFEVVEELQIAAIACDHDRIRGLMQGFIENSSLGVPSV
jgi:FlaA1/EpsC-like NDP-sugar epimerase